MNMECEYAQNRLGRYIDGELPRDEKRSVERHLHGCEACAGELERLQGLNRLLNEAQPRDVAATFARRTRERAESRETAGIRWLGPVVSVFGAGRVRAAVAAVLLFAGLSAGAYLAWSTASMRATRSGSTTVAETTAAGQPDVLATDLAAAPPGSLTSAYLAIASEPDSSE